MAAKEQKSEGSLARTHQDPKVYKLWPDRIVKAYGSSSQGQSDPRKGKKQEISDTCTILPLVEEMVLSSS